MTDRQHDLELVAERANDLLDALAKFWTIEEERGNHPAVSPRAAFALRDLRRALAALEA